MPWTLVRLGGSIVAACVLLDAPAATARQNWQLSVHEDLIRERLAGLLNLPKMVGEGCATPFNPANLYDAPSAVKPASAVLTLGTLNEFEPACRELIVRRGSGQPGEEQLPTEESGYEFPAAIVYERVGTWYRIALKRGSAWMAHPNRKDFMPYPELLLNGRLTFIRIGWDGRLWSAPGTGTRIPIPSELAGNSDDIGIDVIAIRRVQEQSWIRVRLTAQCDEEEVKDGEKPITGWIPAYRPDGRPSAWFYSRGC